MVENTAYTEDNIRSLDWKEHIRMRPGMYIGKLGDGSSADDGIYILLKEVLDNSIDEYVMGAGKSIDISIQGNKVIVRDYGRGIPLGKVVDVVSKMNTGGKYDSIAFKKSVGLEKRDAKYRERKPKNTIINVNCTNLYQKYFVKSEFLKMN